MGAHSSQIDWQKRCANTKANTNTHGHIFMQSVYKLTPPNTVVPQRALLGTVATDQNPFSHDHQNGQQYSQRTEQ